MSSIEIHQACDGITFISCAIDGYFYVLRPDGTQFGKVDIPRNGCRTDTIAKNYFNQDGNYTCRIADYNNITLTERIITVQNGIVVVPNISSDCSKEIVFEFTGSLPQAISNAGLEVLNILSDFLNKITGGKIGTAYFEGSDKLIFPMVGGVSSTVEATIINSPATISLIKWFAGLVGVVLSAGYLRDIITGATTAITVSSSDQAVSDCLSSNMTQEQKSECVKRVLDLPKPTDWGTIALMGIGIIGAAIFLGSRRK